MEYNNKERLKEKEYTKGKRTSDRVRFPLELAVYSIILTYYHACMHVYYNMFIRTD